MAVTGIPLNLLDWAKRQDPSGKTARIVEVLNQKNEILDDMQFVEGNTPTGMRTTVRTGLPASTWRKLNGGVIPSKSTTAQIDEACGMLEAYSEVDKDLADMNSDVGAFRASEAVAFLESMSQTMAQTLFYGDTTINPEQFLGFHPRFNTISGATNAQNIIDAGGTSSNNTSVWLVVWSPNTVTGIFPKEATAGVKQRDFGEVTIEATAGMAGSRLQAYREHFQWKCGIALRDWRYVARLANINVSDLAGSTGTQNASQMIGFMSRLIDRIPFMNSGRAVFYMNRTVASLLRIQALNKSQNAIAINEAVDQFGRTGAMSFFGVPIKIVDQILSTEARIV